MKTHCPYCRIEISDNEGECPGCGNSLSLRCKKCGTLMNREWEKCAYCDYEFLTNKKAEPIEKEQVEPLRKRARNYNIAGWIIIGFSIIGWMSQEIPFFIKLLDMMTIENIIRVTIASFLNFITNVFPWLSLPFFLKARSIKKKIEAIQKESE